MTPDEKRAKQSEWAAAWYKANREKVAEKSRAYYKANREKVAEKARAWSKANQLRVAENQRCWRKANPGNRGNNAELSLASRENLAKCYVAELIGLPVKRIPNHLIEAKREQVLTYRCIKQLQNTLKEKESK